MFEGAHIASGTGTGQHRLRLGDQPQAGCLAETRVGLLASDVSLLSRVVGLYTEDHRHDGDHGGDRQHGDEDSGAFPQRSGVLVGGFQFGFLALPLGLDAVVFPRPGGVQVVAGGVEAVAEAGFGGQGFGVGQAGAFQQPGVVAVAGLPVGGGALQSVGVLEVLGFVAQPGGQFAPLAQQAFQGDLDHGLPVAGVLDQQPLLHHRLDEGMAGGGQVIPAGQAAHRLVVVGVDGGQPRDERIMQGVELGLALLGVGGQQAVDLGLHHLGHPAHRSYSATVRSPSSPKSR